MLIVLTWLGSTGPTFAQTTSSTAAPLARFDVQGSLGWVNAVYPSFLPYDDWDHGVAQGAGGFGGTGPITSRPKSSSRSTFTSSSTGSSRPRPSAGYLSTAHRGTTSGLPVLAWDSSTSSAGIRGSTRSSAPAWIRAGNPRSRRSSRSSCGTSARGPREIEPDGGSDRPPRSRPSPSASWASRPTSRRARSSGPTSEWASTTVSTRWPRAQGSVFDF